MARSRGGKGSSITLSDEQPGTLEAGHISIMRHRDKTVS